MINFNLSIYYNLIVENCQGVRVDMVQVLQKGANKKYLWGNDFSLHLHFVKEKNLPVGPENWDRMDLSQYNTF